VAAFERQKGLQYGEVLARKLVQGEVTIAHARQLLDEFLVKAQKDDTIVVFAAGHGVRKGDDKYYFLTSKDTPGMPYDAIDRSLLEELVTSPHLSARRRVLLIDTCCSGASIGGATRGAAPLFDQTAVDSLHAEERGGIYVLAASSEFGFAHEQQ